MSFDALSAAVIKGDATTAKEEAKNAQASGAAFQDILDNGLIAAMDVVGQKFSEGSMFVPQMLRSAKTMQECVDLIKPSFDDAEISTKGTVVLGTVKGDLHDIGKNLVAMMLEGAGFKIIDLGVDVPPETFVEKIKAENAEIVGMSALLSTTMPAMTDTVKAIEAGLKDKVKIIIGGAPVTEKFAAEIDADAYAPDAGSAVVETKKMLGLS